MIINIKLATCCWISAGVGGTLAAASKELGKQAEGYTIQRDSFAIHDSFAIQLWYIDFANLPNGPTALGHRNYACARDKMLIAKLPPKHP